MATNRNLPHLLCVAALGLIGAMPASATSDDDGFVEAMRLYHDGRFAASFGRLATLADRGDREAARIALLMVRYGPQLYGSEWSASPHQIEQWLALATIRPPRYLAVGAD